MRRVLAAVLALLALTPLIGPLAELVPGYGSQRPRLLASEVTVEGAPTSDEQLQVRGETGEESWTLTLKKTPAGLFDEVPEGERVREASPLGPVDASMQLEAGPVLLERPGNLSPRFPLNARVSVDEDEGVDRAWLRVDGEPRAALETAGHQAGREVRLATLPAETLPAGQTSRLDVVFERRPTPETVQRVRGPAWQVHADATPPPAPEVSREGGELVLEGDAEDFQAEQRPANGSWEPVTVENRTVTDLRGDAAEVRVRSVDEVGNEGPWSEAVRVDSARQAEHEAVPDWELVSPEDGARVDGVVEVDWRPRNVPVEVRARPAEADAWRPVGEAHQPPVRWRTGFVPDGVWELHVRADQGSGWTSRLVTLTVDNLEEDTLEPAQPEPDDGATREPTPRTSSPLSAALASGAGLLALTGLVGRAWTRRPK